MSDKRHVVERIAEALWRERSEDGRGILNWGVEWERFCQMKPDLAAIYRRNAQIAVNAYEKAA